MRESQVFRQQSATISFSGPIEPRQSLFANAVDSDGKQQVGSSCPSLLSGSDGQEEEGQLSDKPCIKEVEDSDSSESGEADNSGGSIDQNFCSSAAKVTSSTGKQGSSSTTSSQ